VTPSTPPPVEDGTTRLELPTGVVILDPRRRLDHHDIGGAGSQTVVFEARWEGDTPAGMPDLLAVKRVDLRQSHETVDRETAAYERIRAHQSRQSGGSALIEWIGDVVSADHDYRYTVMERMGLDSLHFARQITDEVVRQGFARRVLTGGFQGLRELEAARVVARDLHPQNIMVRLGMRPDRIPHDVAIGDFGSAYIPGSGIPTTGRMPGQDVVQSPEVRENQRHGGYIDDLFSLAVSTYVLLGADEWTPWRHPTRPDYLRYTSKVPKGYVLDPDPARLLRLGPELAEAVGKMLAPTAALRRADLERITVLLAGDAQATAPTTPAAPQFATPLTQPPADTEWTETLAAAPAAAATGRAPRANRPVRPSRLATSHDRGLATRADFEVLSEYRGSDAARRAGADAQRSARGSALVMAPVLVAAAFAFAPIAGLRALADAYALPTPFGWIIAAGLAAASVGVALTTFAVMRRSGWDPATTRRTVVPVAIRTGVSVLLAYIALLIVGIESTLIRDGMPGIAWDAGQWGAVQWAAAGPILGAIGLMVALIVFRRSADAVIALGVGITVVVVAGGVANAILWPQVFSGNGTIGAQSPVDCADPLTLSSTSTRFCVEDDTNWTPLSVEQFDDDAVLDGLYWHQDFQTYGRNYPVLALQSDRVECVRAYLRSDTFNGAYTALDDTHFEIGETEVVTSRLDDRGFPDVANFNGTPYSVYRGSADDITISYYRAFAPGSGPEGVYRPYGTTAGYFIFVADGCADDELARMPALEASLMSQIQLRDTGYVEPFSYQADADALSTFDLTVEDLRIPSTKEMGAGWYLERHRAVDDETVDGEIPALGVAVIYLGRSRDDRDAVAHVSFREESFDTVWSDSPYEGWEQTGFVDEPEEEASEDDDEKPSNEGVSSNTYRRLIELPDNRYVYALVRVEAYTDRDLGSGFKDIVGALLAGITIDGEVEEAS
jgi:hypothetical protein